MKGGRGTGCCFAAFAEGKSAAMGHIRNRDQKKEEEEVNTAPITQASYSSW
jgi:hypothetical protein